ncbi:phosphotransferase family protein [Methylocella silvestris]|uniref:Phosphotransferase n=1 Tax=Methylocella silvestris TaxID=199596 RepID=A0A2J7TDP8_METSI|nr:phosphotransferase [Methylocella silvestris]PNG24890.1 phosphotransferase [Methylocella silvestris]
MRKPGEALTDEERLVEALIAATPEWRGLSVRYEAGATPVMSPLHRAVDSVCFAIDVGAAPERFFLKILHPDLWPSVDVGAAFEAARIAAQLGTTPKPLRLFAAERATLFDRLDEMWRTATVDDFADATILFNVVSAKKAIHAGPPFGRKWTVFNGIRQLEADLAAGGIEAPAGVGRLRAAAGNIEQAFILAGWDAKPCHGDGLASNVMVGPGKAIQLVDFDNACDADPYFDLGILLNEALAFDTDMRGALEEFDGCFRPQSLNRCRLYGVADDLYWGLWARLMHAISPRKNLEFLKYSQWRLLRCQIAAGDPRFEAMLQLL